MSKDAEATCYERPVVQLWVIAGLISLIVFLTYLKIEQTKQTGLTIEEYIQQEEHWIA